MRVPKPAFCSPKATPQKSRCVRLRVRRRGDNGQKSLGSQPVATVPPDGRNAALRGLNPKRDLKDAYLPRMLTYPVVGVRPAQARREQQSAPLYLSGRCYGWLRLGYFSTKGAVRVA